MPPDAFRTDELPRMPLNQSYTSTKLAPHAIRAAYIPDVGNSNTGVHTMSHRE